MSKMGIKEAWAIRPTDTYYAVYGALGDSADEDIEDWCHDMLLAVLDEAVTSANILLVKVAGEDPIMSGNTLRARIEALR